MTIRVFFEFLKVTNKWLLYIRRPPQSVGRVRLPPISQQQPASSNPPAATRQRQPASCSQPAKPASQASQPASQASQPANVASGHRSLRPRHQASMAPNSYIGASNRSPQAATGCQTLWHPRHQGAAKHAINPSNIDDMANFPTNHLGGVMGRLWDDHFRDLGYPPKFYRVQDAGFISGSLS